MLSCCRAEAEHDTTNVTGFEEGESNKNLQPQGEYESFVVDTDHPDRQVRIGKALPSHIKTTIQATFIEYWDIFSWTPSDLDTISLEIVIHQLEIPEGTYPII